MTGKSKMYIASKHPSNSVITISPWNMQRYWIGQKVGSGFSATLYGKIQMDFLANPIYLRNFKASSKTVG